MKRGASIVTPDSLAARVADLTSHVDELMVLGESVGITSLSTERLTEIACILMDGVSVRQAALKLVRAEIIPR
jgi:hypothetical protein